MGSGNNTVQVIMVLAVVALVAISGVALYKIFGDETPAGTTVVVPAALTQTGQTVTTNAVVSCPSDGTTDGQVRYQDLLASTLTYGAPTVYFTPKTAGMERVTSGALQTDGTYSTAVNLKCTESGTRWQAIAVTDADDWASAVGEEFVAEGSYAKTELKGKQIGTLQIKIEDKVTGGANYLNHTELGTGYAYVMFNSSKGIFANDAALTGSSLTLGTDGYLDLRIFVKTNETKNQFGEDGLRTFLLVDADTSDWAEPLVARDSGAKLVNVLDSMSSDDRRQYSGYEYAYEIGSIDDREHYIDFYMQSASGVNPDDDPTLEFCAEGRYNSAKELDTIKIGCWNDAATQVEVSTLMRPYFDINIT